MSNLTAHEVFWLARYAHNTLDPLVKEAQAFDPSASLEIQMSFAHENSPYFNESHIGIIVRANSCPNKIMAMGTFTLIATTAQVDAEAAKIRRYIDAQQAVAA